MADQSKAPPKIERTIGKTTYIVTTHFKPQGSTAEQTLKRLIRQTDSGKNE